MSTSLSGKRSGSEKEQIEQRMTKLEAAWDFDVLRICRQGCAKGTGSNRRASERSQAVVGIASISFGKAGGRGRDRGREGSTKDGREQDEHERHRQGHG